MAKQMTGDKIYIYGKHALFEALSSSPKSVKKVFLAHTVDDLKLRELIRKNNIPVAELSPKAVPRNIEEETSHQGVIALVSLENLVRPYNEFVQNLKVTPDTCLVLMDELQDPHNVGAIIRSCAGFGISGVLLPQHNQAPITGTVVKVSAGMAFKIPLVAIGNVNGTIEDLKKRGFWIYGLEGTSTHPLDKEKFDQPTLFVLGNESHGIRQKTREYCDVLLRIPMNPQLESLNVAASTAVTLYSWSTQHPQALE
jgi:23S rRNA (guanosine2251-2'-O)-methyltransferase